MGCSNENYEIVRKGDINYFYNKKPLNNKTTISLIEEVTISNDSIDNEDYRFINPVAVDLDENNNIYILEYTNCSINKFDVNGKFISNFGRMGQGPGEFKQSNSMVILNNKIYVSDLLQRRVVVFNIDGTSNDIIKLNNWAPKNLSKLSDSLIIGIDENNKRMDQGIEFNSSFKIYNNDFKEQNSIENRTEIMNFEKPFNPLNLSIIYASGKKDIFIADNNVNGYSIKNYNASGILKNKIFRSYKKVPASKDYLQRVNNSYSITSRGKKIKAKLNIKYMNAIRFLGVDKYNRLWCLPSVEKNDDFELFDIFENNIYSSQLEFPISLKNSLLFFKKDKIIVLNQEQLKISIYNY